MRIRQRLVSLLLAGALLLPGLPAARALPFGSETGSVSATLRIDYPQSLEALQDRDIQAELFQDGRSLGTIPLTEEDESALLGGYPAAVSLRNPDGGALSGGRWPGFLDLTVSDLPQGAFPSGVLPARHSGNLRRLLHPGRRQRRRSGHHPGPGGSVPGPGLRRPPGPGTL